MRPIPVVLPVVLACLLAACGGGGGGNEVNATPPPTPALQPQTITFSQTGSVNWKLTHGTFTNVASGGPGSGAITYQSSNLEVATVDAVTGVVTPMHVGTAQITATKTADGTYRSATASYMLSILESVSVPFTAAIGAQDAQVSFALGALGFEFLRSTQTDCDVAQFAACTDNRIDTITALTLTDATTKLSTDAVWWLRDGAGIGAPTRISQRRFNARARMTLASFQGKLLAIGGAHTDFSAANDVWSTNDGITWTQIPLNGDFAGRVRSAVATLNDRLWVIGGEGSYLQGPRRDVWSSADGVHWQQATASTPFPSRFFHAAAGFNGRLWMIGGHWGSNQYSDVWWSTDGVQWTAATTSAPFGWRVGHTLTVFDGRMWLIGGVGSSAPAQNDVWSTADGMDWRLDTASAGFPGRTSHAAAALNGRLWVFGGEDSSGTLHDVWSSTDGVNWVEASGDAVYPRRRLFGGTAHDGKLWIAGGELALTQDLPGGGRWSFDTDDVWSSSNGVDWTQMTSYAPFFPGLHNVTALNGKLWVVGGNDLSSPRNDVWSSDDGATWVPSTTSSAVPARGDAAVATFEQQLWVIGGATGSDDSPTLLADVWRSANGTAWSQVTSAAPFGGRREHRVVVFNNRLLLLGGRDASGYRNDVWTSADGSSWSQLTASAAFAPRAHMELAVHDGRLWLVGGSNASTKFTDAWSSIDGITWQLATPNVPHLPFDGIALATHGGKLWLTGGMKQLFNTYGELVFSNAVWSSVDGASWTREPDGLFTGRRGARLISFGGMLRLVGGQDRYGPRNDVWSSVDGTDWRVWYSGSLRQ